MLIETYGLVLLGVICVVGALAIRLWRMAIKRRYVTMQSPSLEWTWKQLRSHQIFLCDLAVLPFVAAISLEMYVYCESFGAVAWLSCLMIGVGVFAIDVFHYPEPIQR